MDSYLSSKTNKRHIEDSSLISRNHIPREYGLVSFVCHFAECHAEGEVGRLPDIDWQPSLFAQAHWSFPFYQDVNTDGAFRTIQNLWTCDSILPILSLSWVLLFSKHFLISLELFCVKSDTGLPCSRSVFYSDILHTQIDRSHIVYEKKNSN